MEFPYMNDVIKIPTQAEIDEVNTKYPITSTFYKKMTEREKEIRLYTIKQYFKQVQKSGDTQDFTKFAKNMADAARGDS